MHAYSTKFETPPQLTLHKLSVTDHALLHQAAIWSEEQWGYVLKFAGLENRKKLIRDLTIHPNAFYVFTYDQQPVALFSLRSYEGREICPELRHLKNILELDYVYADKNFRGLGIGSKILESAKSEAKLAGVKYLAFDTLDPALNPFYLMHGAVIVCKSHYHGLPTDKLMFTLEDNKIIA